VGDKSADLGLFWYSCAVTQRVTYKNSPPNALSKYLCFTYPNQPSQPFPTPSNSPASAFGLRRVGAVYPVSQAMKKMRERT